LYPLLDQCSVRLNGDPKRSQKKKAEMRDEVGTVDSTEFRTTFVVGGEENDDTLKGIETGKIIGRGQQYCHN